MHATLGEASCRFTDYLELSDKAILEELTLKKSRLIDIDQVILGLRNGIPNMLQIQSIIRFFHRAIRLPLEHAPGGKDSEKPPSPDRLADRGVRQIAVQSAQA